MEFSIPLCTDDLLCEKQKRKTEYESYTVEAEWKVPIEDDSQVTAALDGIDERLRRDGIDAISDHENFDTLFFILRQIETASVLSRNKVSDLMSATLQRLAESVQNCVSDSALDRSTQNETRKTLKMYVLLLQMLIHSMERIDAHEALQSVGSVAVSETKGKGKKGKKLTEESSAWCTVREELLVEITAIVEAKLDRLWPMGKVEDDFLRLFALVSYAIMENASAMKITELRFRCFRLLALLATKYHQTPLVTEGIIRMISHKEHISSCVGTMIQCFAVENGHYFIGELFREIGRLDFSELAKDATFAKNIATSIVDSAEVAPDLLMPHIPLLLSHLNGEAYSIRSSLIQASGYILVRVIGSQSNERLSSLKETLLQMIIDRILDMNAFTRSRALQTCAYLCENRIVPAEFFPKLVEKAAGRLHDKTSVVRKSSLQCLIASLQYNPYSGDLSLSVLQTQLEDGLKKLKDLEAIGIGPIVKDEVQPDEPSTLELSNVSSEHDGLETVNLHEEKLSPPNIHTSIEKMKNALYCSKLFQECCNVAAQLLSSKNATDSLEAINFLASAHSFKIEAAQEGVKKMLFLVWSREANVKEALLNSYKQIYLTAPSSTIEAGGEKGESIFIAVSLINLVQDLTLAEVTAFEDLIIQMTKAQHIPRTVIKTLSDVFLMHYDGVSPQQSKMALKLMSLICDPESNALVNVEGLYKNGFGPRSKIDPEIGHLCCLALLRIFGPRKDGTKETKIPIAHEIFSILFDALMNLQPNPQSGSWFPFAESAIDLVYKLCDLPELFCTELIRRITAAAFSENGAPKSPFALSQLLIVAGQVALKQLTYIESMHSKLRKMRHEKEENTKGALGDIESDLGVGRAVTDDVEQDLFNQITEKSLVHQNLLSLYIPLMNQLLINILRISDVILKNALIISFCKFMCVSSVFCEGNLQLFFSLLKNARDPSIRINMSVAVADLAMRFPNLIEPWTSHLYARLDDSELSVKKNALMVLTHLVLNDMIKVKGQIGLLAKLLEDDNVNISDLARLFFHEYSQKGNAIYNAIPDIISHLTGDEHISEEKFSNIMKFLFSYIDKEKHTESLIEKLCHRFKTTKDEKLWRQLSYCLGLLNIGDKGLKKLLDLFKCYQDALLDDYVFQAFSSIVSKTRKFMKPEMKPVADDLEARMKEVRNENDESDLQPNKGHEIESSEMNGNQSHPGVKHPENIKTTRSQTSPSAIKEEDVFQQVNDDGDAFQELTKTRTGATTKKESSTLSKKKTESSSSKSKNAVANTRELSATKQTSMGKPPKARKAKPAQESDESENDADSVLSSSIHSDKENRPNLSATREPRGLRLRENRIESTKSRRSKDVPVPTNHSDGDDSCDEGDQDDDDGDDDVAISDDDFIQPKLTKGSKSSAAVKPKSRTRTKA